MLSQKNPIHQNRILTNWILGVVSEGWDLGFEIYHIPADNKQINTKIKYDLILKFHKSLMNKLMVIKPNF
jgi:hypothetical protein